MWGRNRHNLLNISDMRFLNVDENSWFFGDLADEKRCARSVDGIGFGGIRDYLRKTNMPIEILEQETKRCPFCAETILADAVKCRFCHEFLDRGQPGENPPVKGGADGKPFIFKARPSLWALTPTVMRAVFFVAIAALLYVYPVEGLIAEMSDILPELPEGFEMDVVVIRKLAAFGITALAVLVIIGKALVLKSVSYEVTADRIEYSRGIFFRQVDNMDMFRIIDLQMRRSILDCMVGIGTVTVITRDATDPEFDFKSIKRPRKLYDILKEASLDADQKQRVVHLE